MYIYIENLQQLNVKFQNINHFPNIISPKDRVYFFNNIEASCSILAEFLT